MACLCVHSTLSLPSPRRAAVCPTYVVYWGHVLGVMSRAMHVTLLDVALHLVSVMRRLVVGRLVPLALVLCRELFLWPVSYPVCIASFAIFWGTVGNRTELWLARHTETAVTLVGTGGGWQRVCGRPKRRL